LRTLLLTFTGMDDVVLGKILQSSSMYKFFY
jgi:hypothetical protein